MEKSSTARHIREKVPKSYHIDFSASSLSPICKHLIPSIGVYCILCSGLKLKQQFLLYLRWHDLFIGGYRPRSAYKTASSLLTLSFNSLDYTLEYHSGRTIPVEIYKSKPNFNMAPKVLFVLTSHSKMGDTGNPTGWYLVYTQCSFSFSWNITLTSLSPSLRIPMKSFPHMSPSPLHHPLVAQLHWTPHPSKPQRTIKSALLS
jgi:hypothetical protein